MQTELSSLAVLVQHLNDAFNAHDVNAIMTMLTEDCIFENTYPPPDGARYSGQVEVRRFWQTFFDENPSAYFDVEEIFTSSDRAVLRWVYYWGAEHGHAGHVRGVDILHFRSGKIHAKLSYVKG